MITLPIYVDLEIDEEKTDYELSVEVNSVAVDFTTDSVISIKSYEEYAGEVNITPTEEEQILPTKDTILTKNIVINPIPKNYGRIEWNGSWLTIV